MMKLEPILKSLEYYGQIVNHPIVNECLPFYIDNASRAAIEEGETNIGEVVKTLFDKSDLGSIEIIFHEKTEIAAYLDKGFTKEQIISGESRVDYSRAHGIAERMEYHLLGDVSEKVYGERLPLLYLLASRPFEQYFGGISEDSENLWRHFSEQPLWKIGEGEKFIPVKFDENAFEKSFNLFEIFGSIYNEGYKEEVRTKVQNFIKKANSHYKAAEEKYKQDHIEKERKQNEPQIDFMGIISGQKEEKDRYDLINQKF